MTDINIQNSRTGLEIAVIGMNCRFPGAKNSDEYWENLKNGVESVAFFTDMELSEKDIDKKRLNNPNFIKVAGHLEAIEYFDCTFFGYTPLEAEIMDPQLRIFHESVWAVLENAGYDPFTYEGLIGLYAGACANFYWEAAVELSGRSAVLGWFPSRQLNDKDFMATRIAHRLNLKGPAVMLDTACSTTLVAIHLACQGLLSGDLDIALTGGVNIPLVNTGGYMYQEGMLHSPDGHCRTFDTNAKGTTFGCGVGVVALKRLGEAIEDRDHIYAVIKGTCINNDGSGKPGYTAPSIEGQATVIHTAQKMAEVEPESISYVETHGTGTVLGDPVEIEGLKLAFNTHKRHYCGIGSVKTNFGHLEIAAGAAGFIKTVLALTHRLIPPSLHFETPNPKIGFENSPFYVNTTLKEWKNDKYPLRAGVSSFGLGGTNAHVILEEAPRGTGELAPLSNRQYQLILLSAETETALQQMTLNLAGHFKKNPDINLADAAYTLQVGRKSFKHRRMLVCTEVNEAVETLSEQESGKVHTAFLKKQNNYVVFMFPGLGEQYVNMGLDLYRWEPVFRRETDRCFDILDNLADIDIKNILYPPAGQNTGTDLSAGIDGMEIAPIVIFILEYALAKLLIQWGITPDAMIGYSFGEYAAACVSGVFSLEDALKIVVLRSRLIKETPGGAMLSVPLPKEKLQPLLNQSVLSLAIDNGQSCIVSGLTADIDAFEKRMKESRYICVRLAHASRALHSHIMEPILEKFKENIAGMILKKPNTRYISNVSGTWIADEEAVNPQYWANHLRQTVQFAGGMKTLLKKPGAIFMEIGPGRDISTLTARYIESDGNEQHQVLNLVRPPHQDISDVYFLSSRIGRLWLYGKSIDWAAFHGEEKNRRNRISLPTYPFEGQFYWIDSSSAMEQEKSRRTPDFVDWFYIPTWTHHILLPRDNRDGPVQYSCLVFIDSCGLGQLLVKRLEQEGHEVITVEPGSEFVKKKPGSYIINPKHKEDYISLFKELGTQPVIPSRIVHLWGITGTGSVDGFDTIQDWGFYSLLYIAKAIGKEKLKVKAEFQIDVVTDQLQEVTGEEQLCPAKATINGPVRVIPQEFPGIRCRSIDVLLPEPGSIKEKKLVEQLLEEVLIGSNEPVIAYRGNLRLIQDFNPLPLDKTGENYLKLRENGVYLVSGGLGSIGLMLADYLAGKVKAKLILTSRSPMPDRAEWEQWLKDHDETDPTSQKINRVKELEEVGALVRIFSVDIADKDRMQQVISRAEKELGPINGIIHAAGLIKGKSFRAIQDIEKADCQLQFQAKVKGLLILAELFQDRQPDFCWLISSISTVLGGLGFTAYAAANSFMDAFAREQERTYPGKWISVGWDGMDTEKTQLGFERILSLGKTIRVVASDGGNLQERIDQWVKLEHLEEKDKIFEKEADSRKPRPGLISPYVPPRGSMQQGLVDIWQNFFGFDRVGIQDDFFELGGDSLKALILLPRIQKKLNVEIPIAEFFKGPTIQKLSQYIDGAGKSTFFSIEPAEKKEYYALSSAQKRLYVLQEITPESTAYNEFTTVILEGEVRMERLTGSFKTLIRRHESLRSSFTMSGENPVQRIHNEVEFQIEYYDLTTGDRGQGAEGKPDAHPSSVMSVFIRPFGLSRAPLLRVGLVEIAEEKSLLMVDVHHIISDGTSMGVLVKEFMALYEGKELPRLHLHYKDYAEWETYEQEEIVRQEAYWLKEFEEDIPVLDLPLDYLRPTVQGFAGNSLRFKIDGRDTGALKTLALQRGATLYMVLLAIYNIFLAKTCNQEVIIVGTPTAGRPHADLEQVIGMFVNTLTLKNAPAGEKRFHLFLEEIKEKTVNAFTNQDYQYEELVEKVVSQRDAGRNPLFDTMFVLQNMDIQTIENPGLKLKPYQYEQRISKFDLTLACIEIDDHLSCTLEYSTELFKKETIQRFVNYLKKIVSTVPRDPEQQICRIDMLAEEEKKQLVTVFNDTAEDYPGDKTIYQLFEDRVDQFPDHAALVFDDRAVTFRDFDGRANRLADYLHVEKGVQPGDRVAVLMDRSIELIIVLMAVMKARGAYVPMDVSLPRQRLRIMSCDASIEVAVSQQKYLQKLTGLQTECKILHRILCIEDLDNDSVQRPVTGNPRDPAYVMYTSGSSGIPKGVLVEHRTIVNTIIWRKNNYEYAPGHVSLQVPPYFFDSSVTDIFTPLLGGARLVLVRDDQRSDLTTLGKIITIYNVSHFIVVPVFYNVMLEEIGDDLKYIKMICCAGDNFPDELIKKHFKRLPHVRIFNEYGPTENSVNSTAYQLKPGNPKALIGKPISNVKVYILDGKLSLCPIGVTGEMCLAGSSLAVGYLNRPELTNEKFIIKSFLGSRGDFSKKPLVAEGILYKTGDMGRWLAGGNLEFIGRVDNQVKIRGIRVEIGEIENQLMKHDRIKEAVVQVRQDENDDNYLCAYLVPHSQEQLALKPGELKEYLSRRLPPYMIPSYFQVLEQLPLTPNGKLDVKSLPHPQPEQTEEHAPPRDKTEKKLVEIWQNVLGKNNIGIHDNFFYIGGDSIKSIRIMARMNQAGYKLEMKDIFQYPVISELAPHVKKSHRLPDQSPVTGPVPLTPIQKAFFDGHPVDPHHYNQAVMLYSAAGFDKEIIEKVFVKIQEHHDALRMTYKINNQTGEVIQINHGQDFPLSLQEYDLKGRENTLAELDKEINRVQSSIHLEKGPLMKLGLFHLDGGDRLLIVIHHLVIDGISWRILLEDIETLYRQYQRGEEPALPPKTDAFKQWSEKLQKYAHDKNFLKEKSYWTQLESAAVTPIKKDFQVEKNAVKDNRSVSFYLTETQTTLLLNKVNQCYKTEINDILLTALAVAIKKTCGHDRVLAALEGHGREEILQDMDTARTVGWFTTEYPVLMDVSYSNDTGRQIKEIKETLRKIPNKGIGFGIFKYLTGEAYKKEMEFKLKPQLIFNYLGQFDAGAGQISSFEIAKESAGNTDSLKNQRQYELEINGMTAGNRLSMTISYNKTHFKAKTIAALSGHFQSELEHIIAFCSAKENIEPTPSDFTYKGLPIERLQQLLDLYPDIEDIYTLSPMQEGMLFHALVDESSDSYFQQTAFRLRGKLDTGLVEKSLDQLVKRHAVLRTVFVHKETERPLQVVLKNRPVDFYYRDISHINGSEEKEAFVREFKAKDKKRSFDLTEDRLVRASILRLDKATYEFTWSFHHILMDGWCIGILNNEFFTIYNGYLENNVYPLPVAKPYRTYIQWLEKQDKEESRRYWQYYLDAFEEQTGILKPKLTGNRSAYINEKVSFELSGEETNMLNRLAARRHVTLNIVTQTTWGILLGKYNGKEDVVFGSVVSGRPFQLEGVESMIGLFINTIPVRIRFHEKMKFQQLLQKVQQEAIAAEPYHYHPLADIQSGSPLNQNLMDHIFVFENYPIAEQIQGYDGEKNKSSALQLSGVDVFEQTNYDFNVILSGSDQLIITLQYNASAVGGDDVERMARHFRLLLNQVIGNEELEIEALTLLSQQEKNRLLYEFNDTAAEYPADKTIHRLFEEQAARTPDGIAVTGPLTVSFSQLNKRSDQLALVLREKGACTGSIVGIMVERSLEMVSGILGILKTGGCYMPIDPGYPRERIDFLLKNSGAAIVLTESELSVQPDVRASNSPPPGASDHWSSDLAYIIHTSGSTGYPKGVMVEHRHVIRLVKNTGYVGFTPGGSILQTGALDFDASTFEIWGSLLNGLKLVLVDKATILTPAKFKSALLGYDISTIFLTTGLFSQVLQEDIEVFSGLENLLVGGEVMSPAHMNRLRRKYPQLNIIHCYGPTENTTFSTTLPVFQEYTDNVPIGKPIANSTAYIVDKNNRLQSIGVPGELVLGGDGIARGYLNDPELTAEKFIDYNHEGHEGHEEKKEKKGTKENHSSFITHHSSFLYKTGDQARWLEDGNIEFLGRIDQQVKLRGFRIELAEIEKGLSTHPSIKEAVVTARKDDERHYLCAYFITAGPIGAAGQTSPREIVSVQRLKEYLEGKLPGYMVPACFVKLDTIPLTANGKIDRRKLPRPLDSDFHGGAAYQAPVTDMQQTIADTWREVLGREKIGIRDNFFDLGGNSLDLVAVSNKLREKLDKEVPVATLFTHPTIEDLARCFTAVELPGTSTTAPVPENFVMLNGSPQSTGNIFFVHEVLGDVGAYMEFSKQLGTDTRFNCWGVEAEKLKNYVPQNVTVEEISAKYIQQVKNLQPHGPYNLVTWSWGGHLGLEMALQLEKMGEKLSFLAFVDCSGPDCQKNNRLQGFTLETEKDFLGKLFTGTGNQAELEKINDIQQLWIRAVEVLTSDAALVEELRQLLIENALALPDYDELTGEELVQYLNLNRIHAYASSRYIPVGKIHTPVHFFWANQNPGRVESWKDYCHNPVVYHEINGDHHSIFRNKEQIAEFAARFKEILPKE